MLGERKIIDGALFEKMILGGVANLRANLQEVNDLNVFPIPDGDTGENMYLTLQGGRDGLQAEEDPALGVKAHAMAQGMLLGARGNSGVILSQLFYANQKIRHIKYLYLICLYVPSKFFIISYTSEYFH